MSVTLLTVETLNDQEQHLVVSACTQMGEALPEDDPEKNYCACLRKSKAMRTCKRALNSSPTSKAAKKRAAA
ncbi:hypothetical protein ACFS3C_26865 [Azotobacter vinelandii]